MLTSIGNLLKSIFAIGGLLQLVEPLRSVVTTVEGSGDGLTKKQAVMDFVDQAITAVDGAFGVVLPAGLIKSFCSAVIDLIVTVENMAGRFKHADPAPASAK